ncbi:hypothetical protein [Saccharibacillus sacchari]|uniref:Uncharacterized protein n=1 Tax=Saccharibacillus sacchari TaxID=456493 RepID=A0ACC6P748_9BACL
MTNHEKGKDNHPIEEGIQDYIVSHTRNERVAKIEYRPSRQLDDYFYGKVLENRLPSRLSWLIQEYDELVQHVVMTLLDEVEEEIHTYDLRLERSNQRIYNIMLLGDDLSFFTQPASLGEYPDHLPEDFPTDAPSNPPSGEESKE